jgi:hypothetical protein
VSDCTTRNDTPCTNAGNVTEFNNGDGIDDESAQCAPAKRCAVVKCTCVQ